MTEEIMIKDSNLDGLLNQHFAGKVVRKDLTKLLKEGANVPVYVLEHLLGMYCASDDEATIQSGMTSVKRILAENCQCRAWWIFRRYRASFLLSSRRVFIRIPWMQCSKRSELSDTNIDSKI